MRSVLHVAVVVSGLLLSGCQSVSPQTWGQLGGLLGSKELTTETIVAGLKEALAVGSERAAGSLAKPGGYSANPALKLLVPEQLDKVASTLRKVGMGSYVDQFETKMNEAAEQAAAKAVPVFASAVREMTFADAKGILQGGNTAATDYFRQKTSVPLRDMYAPIVRAKMDEVGTGKVYNSLIDKYTAIPLTSKPSFALEDYVTDRALTGLFSKLGEMEAQIRADPAARTTALLKQVFGSIQKN
jgi:outer membrane murein-binding lipoprotein Lpp